MPKKPKTQSIQTQTKKEDKNKELKRLLKGHSLINGNSLKRILNPKLSCYRKYTEEEMARGFMLKAMSNKAHNHGGKKSPCMESWAMIVSADILERSKFAQYFLDLLLYRSS